MPEIGEVARVVHYLRKNLVGKTLKKVIGAPDDIVYGKVGTSAEAFEKALTGKKVLEAGQQGKYFWMIMSSPPHPLMHLGMSGWFKFANEHTFYYQPKKGEDDEMWPPKFWKFHLETDSKKDGGEKVQAALVDMRRLARVRLIDCDGKEIRKYSPLKENGPDPVIDKDIFTLEWLTEKCAKKKVPIKAMLLDQANVSGIGNWVGDEVMYHAKIHPEQYANTLQESQVKQLYESINYVCGLAVETLSDSDKFPEEWLFKHRWGKGKKNASHTMPNGEKIVFLTVGGRTSAVIPSVQKKTGPVAKEMDEAEEKDSDDGTEKTETKSTKVGRSRKRKAAEEPEVEDREAAAKEASPPPKKATRSKKTKTVKAEVEEEEPSSEPTPPKKPSRTASRDSVKADPDAKHIKKASVTSAPAKSSKKAADASATAKAASTTAKESKAKPAKETAGKPKGVKKEEVGAVSKSDGRRRSARISK